MIIIYEQQQQHWDTSAVFFAVVGFLLLFFNFRKNPNTASPFNNHRESRDSPETP